MSYKWFTHDTDDNHNIDRVDNDYTSNPKRVFTIDSATGALILGNSDLGPGIVRLHESGAAEEYVELKAPAITTSFSLTLPAAKGTTGQSLVTTDTAGTLGWASKPKTWLPFGLSSTNNTTAAYTWKLGAGGSAGNGGFRLPSACTATSVSAQCVVYGNTGTTTVYVDVHKEENSTAEETYSFATAATSGTIGFSGALSTPISFAAGDTIEVCLRVSSTDLSIGLVSVVVEFE